MLPISWTTKHQVCASVSPKPAMFFVPLARIKHFACAEKDKAQPPNLAYCTCMQIIMRNIVPYTMPNAKLCVQVQV